MENTNKSLITQPTDQPTSTTGADMRHPSVPASLDELAGRKGEALEILAARIEILRSLRRAALRMTSPEDWVLFRDRAGRVVGYLSDAGCQRVRDLYGIEIFDISDPVREKGDTQGEYFVMLKGSGRCALTGQVVEGVWGGRSSAEEFNTGKSPMQARLDTLKAARANLDGQITRELAGLNAVPAEELAAAWEGSHKTVEHCRRGRGFGSQAQREIQHEAETVSKVQAEVKTQARTAAQAEVESIPQAGELPPCPQCGSATRFQPAGTSKRTGKPYPAFLSCSNRDCGWTKNWDDWLKTVGTLTTAAAEPESEPPPPPKTASSGSDKPKPVSPIELTADDIPF